MKSGCHRVGALPNWQLPVRQARQPAFLINQSQRPHQPTALAGLPAKQAIPVCATPFQALHLHHNHLARRCCVRSSTARCPSSWCGTALARWTTSRWWASRSSLTPWRATTSPPGHTPSTIGSERTAWPGACPGAVAASDCCWCMSTCMPAGAGARARARAQASPISWVSCPVCCMC